MFFLLWFLLSLEGCYYISESSGSFLSTAHVIVVAVVVLVVLVLVAVNVPAEEEEPGTVSSPSSSFWTLSASAEAAESERHTQEAMGGRAKTNVSTENPQEAGD